ncbi:MAG: redoxin domain-containing protein [Methanomassiliicoccus sp.]|nr:redoxin domain-containing protein [Methanomassiliicoccus sp.]
MADGPHEGDRAPDFCLLEASEEMICLSDSLKGRALVIIFYPTDFGITCTQEFKRFKEMSGEFAEAGAGLLGISVSSTRSHRAWKERMDMNIPLLSDWEAKTSRTYNVMSPEDSLLKGYSTRAIFIVDRDQVIRYRWVPPDSHTQPDYDLILGKVRELRTNTV